MTVGCKRYISHDGRKRLWLTAAETVQFCDQVGEVEGS